MWKLWQLCDDSSSKRSPRDLARIKYENLWKLWEFEISVWIEYEYLRLWEFICEAQDYESGLVQLLIRILWIPMFLRQGKDVWNLKPEAFDIFIKSGKCSSRLEEHQKAQLGELEIRITLNQTSCLTLMFFLFYLDGHRKHALSLHNVHLRIWPEIDKNIFHRGNCPCFISLTIIIIITTIKGSNHDDHDHHHNDYHLSSAALNNWTIFLVASISAVAFSVTPPHRLRRFQWFYNNGNRNFGLLCSNLTRPLSLFYSFLCLFLCLQSSVLDKGPCGLKVLAKNKFKCKESLFNAVEKRIWELLNLYMTSDVLLSNGPKYCHILLHAAPHHVTQQCNTPAIKSDSHFFPDFPSSDLLPAPRSIHMHQKCH